ncbi:hypothetical protein LCGC14_2553800 [marine sediment metagenome]|uniref:Uncharacterized protein n=1 Tax=marine sediment metagenome TaxID=412755 RepID=A0A0F9CY96_9ZZZZ
MIIDFMPVLIINFLTFAVLWFVIFNIGLFIFAGFKFIMKGNKERMKKIPTIIRFILTLALILGVYTETGFWTSLSLFLIFIYVELTFQKKKINITMKQDSFSLYRSAMKEKEPIRDE